MSARSKVEVWVWVLVYGGMIVLGIGLAVQGTDAATGWVMAGLGATLIAVGALLVWVRSRMHNDA
jgi:hypothetical protein